ncbi:MAG: hypothetical protein KDJ77_06130 [Rhodobiaceae bacterium]|nr:hypothetical protein [Rhodobiaceae bacterium]
MAKTTAALTLLAALAAATPPAHAGFDTLAGKWMSEPLALEDAPDCAPETVSVTVSGYPDKPKMTVKAGGSIDLDLQLAKGEDGKVFVERGGWLNRFGLSDKTTREALENHEPFVWARETDTGAVLYRARITEEGGLNLFRLALEPVDDALAATFELTDGDCQFGPATTSLFKQ